MGGFRLSVTNHFAAGTLRRTGSPLAPHRSRSTGGGDEFKIRVSHQKRYATSESTFASSTGKSAKSRAMRLTISFSAASSHCEPPRPLQ
jgi:hypothetical protein